MDFKHGIFSSILLSIFSCILLGILLPVRAQDLTTTPERWMAQLTDTVRLNRISIPGSRMSTYFSNGNLFYSWYYIQSGSIEEQFNAGIRALDISLKPVDETALQVVYDKDSRPILDFSADVLRVAAEFLDKHPSETLFIFVRATDPTGENIASRIDASLAPYVDRLYIQKPALDIRLGDARGKFIVIRCGENSKSPNNIDWFLPTWSQTESNVSSTIRAGESTATVSIADYFRESGALRDWSAKQTSLEKAFENAKESPPNYQGFSLTFTGFERTGVGPAEFSRKINPWVTQRLRENVGRTFGIVMLDFVLGSSILGNKDESTKDVTAALLRSNAEYSLNSWTGTADSLWSNPGNWFKGIVPPSDGSFALHIAPDAKNSLVIADTCRIASFRNPKGKDLRISVGGLLHIASADLPYTDNGIVIEHNLNGSGSFYVPVSDNKRLPEVTHSYRFLPITTAEWLYFTPPVSMFVPNSLFAKSSVMLRQGDSWLSADSTQIQQPYRSFALNAVSPKANYRVKGHILLPPVDLSPTPSPVYKSAFWGNALPVNIPIIQLQAETEIDHCVYLPIQFRGHTAITHNTSAGKPMAVPFRLAGSFGLPGYITPGGSFFVFGKSGNLTIPYVDPLVAQSISSDSKGVLLLDLSSEKGELLDIARIFYAPEYTNGYDQGYDGFKLLSNKGAELMIASDDGDLQVAALPGLCRTQLIVRPDTTHTAYRLSITAAGNEVPDLRGYCFADYSAGIVLPLPLADPYSFELKAGEQQRVFAIFPGGSAGIGRTPVLPTHTIRAYPLSGGRIQIIKPREIVRLAIYTLMGTCVAGWNLPATITDAEIDTALPPGYYVLRFEGDNICQTSRIQICR